MSCTKPGVAELADALDSKSSARRLLIPPHLCSRFLKLYQQERPCGFQRCASLLILAHREVIDKLKKKAGCALLVLALLVPAVHAQERKAYTVPFHSVNGMILLDAQVNRKPAGLLLDTGANNTLITPQAAGLGVKLDALKPTNTSGSSGEYMKGRVDLRLEKRHWIEREVLIMDLSEAGKRIGERVDGFIGQDLLREFFVVRIDYKAGAVEFEK